MCATAAAAVQTKAVTNWDRRHTKNTLSRKNVAKCAYIVYANAIGNSYRTYNTHACVYKCQQFMSECFDFTHTNE